MTKKIDADAPLSRRKMLTRTGLVAAAAYTVPAFTTLSVAQADDGASGSSNDSSSNDSSSNDSSNDSGSSSASAASAPSGPSDTSTPTDSVGGTAALDLCGPENLNDPTYLQCLIDNGL